MARSKRKAETKATGESKAPRVVLSKPWGGFAEGTALEVLAPGEDLRPGAVDPARARALVDQGFAEAEG